MKIINIKNNYLRKLAIILYFVFVCLPVILTKTIISVIIKSISGAIIGIIEAIDNILNEYYWVIKAIRTSWRGK